VHRVRTDFLDADALARCAAEGLARTTVETFSDIEHALTNLDELAPLAPDVPDLGACIADSLRQTGVLGEDAADYRHSLDTRSTSSPPAARASTTTSAAIGRAACSGRWRWPSPMSSS
jgi:hypothetical protein